MHLMHRPQPLSEHCWGVGGKCFAFARARARARASCACVVRAAGACRACAGARALVRGMVWYCTDLGAVVGEAREECEEHNVEGDHGQHAIKRKAEQTWGAADTERRRVSATTDMSFMERVLGVVGCWLGRARLSTAPSLANLRCHRP